MSYLRGISTLGCGDLTLPDVLALAARHRLDAVELRALGGTIGLPAYLTNCYGSPAALAEALRPTAIRVVAFDTSLKLIGSGPADREALLAFVPWAEALGVRWLRAFDGGATLDVGGLAEAAATVRWWRELRAKNDWRTDLIVETHDTLLDAAKIGQFLAVAPGTAILWDAHHTWRRGGEDPVVTWRAIRPHVAHVHVKDSVSRPRGSFPFTYVLPGDGEFPMRELRNVLRSTFSGTVSLEWERLWHPDLPPLDDALEAAARHRWW